MPQTDLKISHKTVIPLNEVEIRAVRSQGAGGQHVNKTSSAVHLRFDIASSSLPDVYKQRLSRLRDQRITSEGVVVIKAQSHRSQQMNRQEALSRLRELIQEAGESHKKRIPTRPGRGKREKRLEQKKHRGRIKGLRGKIR